MNLCSRLCGTMLFLCTAYSASAQHSDPIIAERPGFSSSPWTLAPGVLQVEGGYKYSQYGDGIDIDDHTLPLLLIRVGMLDRLELQINWAGISWVDANGRDFSGANDLSLGVKWQVSGRNAAVPLGIFAGLSLPVGTSELTSDEVDPALGLFWSFSGIADFFGTVALSDSDDESSLVNAAGVSFSLDQNRGAYVEYFGTFTERSRPAHVLNGGITLLRSNDLQLDVNVGLGLNDEAPDFFVGAGMAYRF